MSVKAKAIYTLYRTNHITIEGVKRAVIEGIITPEDYAKITGKTYS